MGKIRMTDFLKKKKKKKATSGTLATSGVPEGNPRVRQMQRGRQQPASGLADANTEETKINHSPGLPVIPPECRAYHLLIGSRVLEHKIIGAWWRLNYSRIL